jgi:hypothetical protein
MLTYIKHIFSNLNKYSQKLDDITIFQNQKWINIDEIGTRKKVFIFRPDNKLLLSIDGNVKKGSWEYIDSTTIVLEIDNEPILLRHSFIDDEFLILNKDNTDNFALFIKENEALSGLNTLDKINLYIEEKYQRNKLPSIISSNKNYKLKNTIECSNLEWGKHIKYEIQFDFSINIDEYYQGNSSGKYFCLDKNGKKQYKKNLDEAIDELYKEALLRISK